MFVHVLFVHVFVLYIHNIYQSYRFGMHKGVAVNFPHKCKNANRQGLYTVTPPPIKRPLGGNIQYGVVGGISNFRTFLPNENRTIIK